MEAHEALGRVETMHSGHHGGHHHPRDGFASVAGVVVAVLAAFLAIATFLANEQVKDVITRETHGADLSAQYEVNSVKQTIAENDALLLRTVGTGNPQALAHAEKLEARRAGELAPKNAQLQAEIAASEAERTSSDQKHLLYEIAEVALQVGIVLAGISILIRRRWLLASGGAAGVAGVIVLLVGLAY
jgi:adenine-specific DNA methylase